MADASAHVAQPLAHATNGLDAVVAELLAQVADVDVDDVGARVVVVAPVGA